MSTPCENLKREAAVIAEKTGVYIPPHRLAELMKAAQKITDVLQKNVYFVNYEESQFVLRVVMRAIEEAQGGYKNEETT